MYIPKTVTKYQNRKCLCDHKECRQIVRDFQDIEDIRGQYKKVPNTTVEGSRKEGVCKIINEWKSRFCFSPRYQSKQTETKDAFIALWHYHPRLLQFQQLKWKESEGKMPVLHDLTMEIKVLELLELYDTRGIERPYSKTDLSSNGGILITPTYLNATTVKEDIHKARKWKHTHDVIDSAKSFSNPSSERRHSLRSYAASNKIRDSKTSSSAHANRNTLLSRVTELEKMLDEKDNELHILRRAVGGDNMLGEDVDTHQIQNALDYINSSKEDDYYDQSTFIEHLTIKAGLNRISLSNKNFFKRNKGLCKELYGFPSFTYLKIFIEQMFDTEFKKVMRSNVSTNYPLYDFEQILLTMLYCNSDWSSRVIGSIYGIRCMQTVDTYINRWLPILGELGDALTHLAPFLDEDILNKLEPESYKEMDLRDIVSVVDGKDFPCETVRVSKVVHALQASNKIHDSAMRALTWSHPCGLIIERTPAFFGRSSEKGIMRAWGERGCLTFPAGKRNLGDKGFDNTAYCYTNLNITLHPAFLMNKQFSSEEIEHCMKVSQKRYSSEVVFSRVTETKRVGNKIRRESFSRFDDMLSWAHAKANVCYGYLQKIDGYTH